MTKFETGKITPGSLLRYVFRLNRAEFRWIVLSMILLALVSVAAPIFNEQIFSVVIPNADRALMVQVFSNGAISTLFNVVTLVPATVMMCVYSPDAVKWFLPVLVVLAILEAAAVADDIRAMPTRSGRCSKGRK